MCTLEVVDDGNWRLMWRDTSAGDHGAPLGDGSPPRTEADLSSAEDNDDWRTIRAELIAEASTDVARDEWGGFYWPSKKAAGAALRVIKAAWKDRSGVPWPDWAVKASAAGWKPPKGWVP